MTGWAGVVMAAGTGSRMRSRRPKVLHAIAGRPLLRCVLDAICEAGIPRTVVVIARGAEDVRAAAGAGVSIAVQARQAGTADAVHSAREACAGSQQILVSNGDLPLILPSTLSALCQNHEHSGASVTLLTTITDERSGMARVQRGAAGDPIAIVEERDADAATLAIEEINAGVYCFRADWLWPHLGLIQPSPVTGEIYLTELIRIAAAEGAKIGAQRTDTDEVRGVNSRAELAVAERVMRSRIRNALMESGVTLLDPATAYVDFGVQIGCDTIIGPNTTISGATRIGEDCEVGPNSLIRSSQIGAGCRIVASVIENSIVEAGVAIGPFSHLREGAHIESGAQLGNYAEVKKSRIGAGTQMHHFSYIGDAQVGRNVNIGAGTITCNFDGKNKHETIIGEGAFIGSDTMLVAPVTVGDGGRTGAGSVVTRNVAAGSLVIGVPARPRTRDSETDSASRRSN